VSATLRFRIGTIVALALLLFAFVSIVWTPYGVDNLSIGDSMQGRAARTSWAPTSSAEMSRRC